MDRKNYSHMVLYRPKCSRDSSLEAFAVCEGYSCPEGFQHGELLSYLARSTGYLQRNLHLIEALPFVSCGGADAYDADKTYPLEIEGLPAYQQLDPVQPPIHPPYEMAQKMRKEKNLSSNADV